MAIFVTTVPAWAQSSQVSSAVQRPKSPSNKVVHISGEAGNDGQTFTPDRDGTIWQVRNPESLRSISGQHVTINTSVTSGTNGIQVFSVKAFRPERTTVKFDDAAFRK